MTASQIIQKFELYMDDTTELSSSEELGLLNKIYQMVSNQVPWESLKKVHTGTVSGTSLTLPARFSRFSENNNWTSDNEYAEGPVVFVGSDYTPYKIISFSDRRQYRTKQGYAYLDLANSNLEFTVAPSSTSVEFDYIEYPATLTTSDTPWIPERFQDVLYHGMCVDDFAIQQSEKARSYRNENLAAYNMWLNELKAWNASLVQLT